MILDEFIPERVASFAEAWIEIYNLIKSVNFNIVASFAEAWIEILPADTSLEDLESPPSRRRGLKFDWIVFQMQRCGRLLRGGVD